MTLTVIPVTGLPEVRHGDDLPALIAGAADLQDGDVVVVSQKVVSKVEGAVVSLQAGEGAAEARRRLAREQATEVVADSPWVLIVRTRHGLVCANAGIDASNVEPGLLTLLPDDPDRSARLIRDGLRAAAGVDVAVIVSDTFGRPWRNGQTDVAIGVAGLVPVRDERGAADRFGTTLDVTEAAVADELAGAADLVRTKASGVPVVVVRGFDVAPSEVATAQQLVRDGERDLFRRGAGMLAARLAEQPGSAPVVGSLEDGEIDAVRRVAPGMVVDDPGPPTRLVVDDAVLAGLAVAVLVDHGATVRWRRDGDVVILEAGRTGAPR